MTQQIIVNIDEGKLPQFLKEIEKLEYAHVDDLDWWDNLSKKQKNKIQKSVEMLDAGMGVEDEEVKRKVDKLLKRKII